MRQDARAPFDRALRTARVAAYPPGQFVGQESFMRADEILSLARGAGVSTGTRVLDLCCGVAGPGRFITTTLGCTYLGVDASAAALELARARAQGLPCRFQRAEVPPVPTGPFDVVLLLETLLAFPDKGPLLRAVTAALPPGGRFAFTLEEGAPLTEAEAARMPDAETVWLTPLTELLDSLRDARLAVRWTEDRSAAHLEVFEALHDAFTADRVSIAREVGDRAVEELLASHDLWCRWLRCGRVRKLALVAERVA
jgi:sarcosine/dimethylglycine N-methyltransferase